MSSFSSHFKNTAIQILPKKCENVYSLEDGFYIPRIGIEYSFQDIKYILSIVGNVCRIDFNKLTKNKNTTQNKKYHSAFIHFNSINSNLTTDQIKHTLFKLNDCRIVNNDELYIKQCCIHKYPSTGQGFKFYINNSTNYLLLFPNKNTVADTKLNIHQVVENARILEERVESQSTDIENMKKMIIALQEQLSVVINEKIK
jgi:hypothetical protein